MEFDLSAGRIWRRLTREERLGAAREFWADPASEAVAQAPERAAAGTEAAR